MFRMPILSIDEGTTRGLSFCRLTVSPGRQLGPLAPGKPWHEDWRSVIPTVYSSLNYACTPLASTASSLNSLNILCHDEFSKQYQIQYDKGIGQVQFKLCSGAPLLAPISL